MLSEKEIEVIRDGWSGEASLSREGEDINDLLDTIKARDERIGVLERDKKLQRATIDRLIVNRDSSPIAIENGRLFNQNSSLLKKVVPMEIKLTAAEDEVKRLRGVLEDIADRQNCRCITPSDYLCISCTTKKALASSSGEGERWKIRL